MTMTGLDPSPGPPMALSQDSVEEEELWDMATKWIEGFEEAVSRRLMKFASAKGHPQCLRNVIIVGRLSLAGSGS